MRWRLVAASLYAASAVICTGLYALSGGPRWGSVGPWWLELPLRYEIAPFAAAAVVVAATRLYSSAHPMLELAAALLWCGTFLAFALWHPMFTTIERLGAPLIDGVASLAAVTGLAFIAVAIQGTVAAGFSARAAVQAAGIGLLGLYLERVAALMYASTRVTLSGGLGALILEAQLRVYVCLAVIVALITGSLMPARRVVGHH